jgi:hypothetical protein
MNLKNARCNSKDRLRVFENRVLRRIFGSKKDEVRGEWRKDIIWSLIIVVLTK